MKDLDKEKVLFGKLLGEGGGKRTCHGFQHGRQTA